MKRAMRTVLCLILAAGLRLPLPANESRLNGASGCASASQKLYTQEAVDQILQIAQEETARAVAQAYDEGYKAAMLKCRPEAVYLEGVNAELKKDAETLRADTQRTIPAWHAPVWAFAGIVLGYGLRLGLEQVGK